MNLSYEEALTKIEAEYPKCEVQFGVPYKKGYLFCLLPKGGDPSKDISDFHYLEASDGSISGSVPTMKLMEDPEFQRALTKVRKKKFVDYLEHHGIEGQKWGVRNGPPYPLTKSKHDAIVKGEADGERKNGFLITLGLTALANTLVYNSVRKHYDDPNNVEDRLKNPYGGTVESIKNDSSILYNTELANDRQFSDKKPPRKISGDHSQEDDVKKVNPLYGPAVPGSTNNCSLCSITYDIRRRGYDVVANLSTTPTNTDMLANKVYKNYKAATLNDISSDSFEKVEQNMVKKYPEGSRGILQIAAYKTFVGLYGGHAIAFEIKNGKVVIYDAQIGQKYDFKKVASLGYSPKWTRATRIDNLDINFEYLNTICSERKVNKS